MDVGFIGLGIMGAPMAGHLVAGGHRLHLKAPRSVPEPPLPAGDIASAREVAEHSDVVIREGAVTAERCERRCNVPGRPYRVLGKRKALFLSWSKDAVLERCWVVERIFWGPRRCSRFYCERADRLSVAAGCLVCVSSHRAVNTLDGLA